WPPHRLRHDVRPAAPPRCQRNFHRRRPRPDRGSSIACRLRYGAEGFAPACRALSAEPRAGGTDPGRSAGGGIGGRRSFHPGSRSRRHLPAAHAGRPREPSARGTGPRKIGKSAKGIAVSASRRVLRLFSVLILPLLLIACAPRLQPPGPAVMTPKFEDTKL